MNQYLVEIVWSDDDEGFIATVPDLPGCSAWGQSREDAAREIEDAQAAWLEACVASGEPVPVPVPRLRARQAA
jgi:predicted RNase H-like HicB family nuclease